jgi:adenine-specific DNA-methyltransferase
MKPDQQEFRCPEPAAGISAAQYASQLAEFYCTRVPKNERKPLGQFFTPPDVAAFMANTRVGRPRRVLDPAAGTGTLVCALLDSLSAKGEKRPLHADTYEIDDTLAKVLTRSLSYAARRYPWFSFRVHNKDFVSEYIDGCASLFSARSENYDLAVGNPPYFKLPATSKPVRAAKTAQIEGRSNIYSLMMAATAQLLRENGQMIFIVPRSFCSGLYFKHFRRQILVQLSLEQVHVFHSRRSAFRNDDVLQENIIVRLVNRPQKPRVRITSSAGIEDMDQARGTWVDSQAIITDAYAVRLPTSTSDLSVLESVESWPHSLHSMGLEISTGPVVAHRSADWLDEKESDYPLFLLNNVRCMDVDWPLPNGKPQYVRRCPEAQKWLVPRGNYVLLRRFSAKEDPSRLLAAPLLKDDVRAEYIGIENHVNFIHRTGGTLSPEEATGMSALLNSRLLDRYFRIINGSTQVNATDLRALPLPPTGVIRRIGRSVLAGTAWENALQDVPLGVESPSLLTAVPL